MDYVGLLALPIVCSARVGSLVGSLAYFLAYFLAYSLAHDPTAALPRLF